MASKKVTNIEEKAVTERAAILFKCVAFAGEATNLTNMLFTKRGDIYMEYCSSFPKSKISYPVLRSAIEQDLALAPTREISRTVLSKTGTATVKKVVVYPWGEQSIKGKAHSLAVSMLKTFQRRTLKFDKDHTTLKGVTLFSKFSNYGKTDAKEEVKTFDSITYKSIHKSFDEKRALDFLNSFLKPAAPKAAKKAA